MSNTLAKSAAVILAVTFVGKIIGLVRDGFIASAYGLSYQADVYNWIIGIILTLYMIIPGSINAVYIPIISKYLSKQDSKRRNQLFQSVFTVVLFTFIVFTLFLYLFTPQIIAFLQPGYDERSMALGIELFRLSIPAMFVMGIIGLLMSVSYSHKQFFLPSVGTVIFSVSVILTIVIFVPHYGIQGLMVGTVIGYIIFAALLVVATKRKKYPFSPRLGVTKDADLKKMGELAVPILIGSAISQSYFYVNQALASTLADGAQSAIIFANKLFLLPSAIFVGAFTIPLLPILSELVKQNKLDETKRILRKGTSYMHLLMLPTTVAFIIIGDSFISLVFERGLFSASDTQRTYYALIFFSFALLPLAVRDMITRTYYALEDTKTPMIVGLFSVFVNFGVALLLTPYLQHGAMALGFSVASLFNLIILEYLLRKRIGSIYDKNYWYSFLKASIASVGMGLVLWPFKQYLEHFSISVLVKAPVMVVVGAMVYYMILVISREKLIEEVKHLVNQKLTRNK